MSGTITMPHLSLGDDDERAERTKRLLHPFAVMCGVVRVLWPGDDMIRDPDAVRWDGAVLRLHQVQGRLYVAWKDEDHWNKYAKVVELAWSATDFESGQVIHENADENGLTLPQDEPMY